MKFVCPLIVVKDIKRSRFLYESLLGQKVIADFGQNISFEGPFAIHLKEHFAQLLDGANIERPLNSSELYFEEDELEPLAEKLKKEGLKFAHNIREQPWRQKVMRVYDYDNNLLEFGESMQHVAWRLSEEGLNIEEIAKITYLATNMVKQSIKEHSK